MEESSHDSGPLDDKTGNQEVYTDTGETISLQEGHQEAETNEHHNMDILEHWENIRYKNITHTSKSYITHKIIH